MFAKKDEKVRRPRGYWRRTAAREVCACVRAHACVRVGACMRARAVRCARACVCACNVYLCACTRDSCVIFLLHDAVIFKN